MNLLLLLPGLFTLLEKVVGPMLAGNSGSIAQKIMGLGSGATLSGVMGVITGTLGNLEDTKRIEIQAELGLLMEQCKINETDATSSDSFYYKGARPFIFWGFGIITLFHCLMAEMYNNLIAIGYNVGHLAPMDNMAWYMLGGLAGIWAISRGIEKVNANSSDDQ